VAIAAPHTTNWDLLYLLLHAWYHDLPMRWLGKDTLFRWPAGPVLRALGGIAVERDSKSGLVRSLADRFDAAAADDRRFVLVIPPEGTRRARDYWKSGFYEIARAADVPIACIYLDYERRVGGFGPTVEVSGDVDADLATIRDFVTGVRGKYPEMASTVAFRPRDVSDPPD
jgi:1-acyl-sn-glycerol-3-phosphate acyltransferase